MPWYVADRSSVEIQETESWLVARLGNQDTVIVRVIGRLRSRTSCCTGHGRLSRFVGLIGGVVVAGVAAVPVSVLFGNRRRHIGGAL